MTTVQDVSRIQVPRSKLEAILLEFLRAYPWCKEATGVSVRRLMSDLENGANWTVETFNPGRSLRKRCDTAMKLILPVVQNHFSLSPDA
jgi:hypothetical protein